MDYLKHTQIPARILEFEQKGLVTRTFRRLDPERQAAVIAAILEEATEHGPPAINIKRVAERAGVSVGSLYQYFGSREGLLAFATELVVGSMVELFDAAGPYLTAMPLGEALAGYLSGGIEWSEAQSGALQFFARAAYHGDSPLQESVVRPVAEVMRSLVQDMLALAVERGEVRADIDLEATARLVHALVTIFGDAQIFPYLNTYFQITSAEVSYERSLAALMTLILEGIAVKRTEDKP